MSDNELGGVNEAWAVRGKRKSGKLNTDVPALLASVENQIDTSGHF